MIRDINQLPPYLLERIYIEPNSGCWIWLGAWFQDGYGQAGRRGYVHKVIYEFFYGAVPEGLELDHLCRTKCCTNPLHLEAVTHRINMLRGYGPAAQNARKTHCKNGHPYTEENTYYYRNNRSCKICRRGGKLRVPSSQKTHCKKGHPFDGFAYGQRICSICRRESDRAYKLRKKVMT